MKKLLRNGRDTRPPACKRQPQNVASGSINHAEKFADFRPEPIAFVQPAIAPKKVPDSTPSRCRWHRRFTSVTLVATWAVPLAAYRHYRATTGPPRLT